MNNAHTLADGTPVTLAKGRPLADPPQSWVRCGFVHGPTGSYYNGSTIQLFKAKDGSYRWEQYRDGCFDAFYGRVLIN